MPVRIPHCRGPWQGVYELKAFISHMGKSMTSGHYVCHIKKPDGALRP